MTKLVMVYFNVMIALGSLLGLATGILDFWNREAACYVAVAMGCIALPPMIFLLIVLLKGIDINGEEEEL